MEKLCWRRQSLRRANAKLERWSNREHYVNHRHDGAMRNDDSSSSNNDRNNSNDEDDDDDHDNERENSKREMVACGCCYCLMI